MRLSTGDNPCRTRGGTREKGPRMSTMCKAQGSETHLKSMCKAQGSETHLKSILLNPTSKRYSSYCCCCCTVAQILWPKLLLSRACRWPMRSGAPIRGLLLGDVVRDREGKNCCKLYYYSYPEHTKPLT